MASLNFIFGFGPMWRGSWSVGYIEDNRRLYDFEIVYVNSGKIRIVTEKGIFIAKTGDVAVIPPGILHSTVALSACERICIHFSWYDDCQMPVYPFDAHWVCENGKVPFDPSLQVRTPEIPSVEFPLLRHVPSREFQQLLYDYFKTSDDTLAGIICKRGILGQIIGTILTNTPLPGEQMRTEPKRYLDIKKHLEENYTDPSLEINKLARQFQMTPGHLCKCFHNTFGMSPKAYLITLRLNEARILLANSNFNVREVAFHCGFNDPNYFTRLFRRRFGFSPSQLKHQQRRNSF